VEQGTLRVDSGPGGEPRYLRPGQIFGSTSLLRNRLSPSNVTAQDDVVALSLTPRELDWLTEAEPAVSARLIRALAAGLAARTFDLPVGAGAVQEQSAARQETSGLARLAEACRETRRALEALGAVPEEGAAHWAR